MNIRWIDNIFGMSGYAHNVRSVAYEIYKQGIDVKCICPFAPASYLPDGHHAIWTDTFVPDDETVVVGRIYSDVHQFRHSPHKLIAGMMVLEGDRLPESWVLKANLIDQLWATSNYNKEQFIKNGIVEDKIKVIHHGVDENIYNCRGREQIQRPFRFLFVGGYALRGDRKGADDLVRGFAEEFSEEEKVELVLKINTFYNPRFDVLKDLTEIAKNHKGIKIVTDFMNDRQLANLYRDSDVGVCPTKGEGFGMTMAESMACGTPVIATNYSGHLDFTLPEFSYLIDVEKFIPATYGIWDIHAGTNWAQPSIKHMRELMRYCYDNQDEVRKKGKRASEFILSNFKWSDAARKTLEVINNAV